VASTSPRRCTPSMILLVWSSDACLTTTGGEIEIMG
jgi:hypothetical protein